ncbi:MAG: hypothetical protein ACK4SZ_13055 [Allosphingosinicella sp.]|uniref:hypothetical protein n=1 Tax=Allosphingosinicella sp. TaxID=2823234 RepID=UPI00393DB6D1
MNKHVRFGAVLASALVLAACGGAQGDERSDRRDRSEESRDSRDERDSDRGRDEGTREDSRSERGSEERTSSRDSTNQNFVMRNNTGQTITHVYVSPITSNNWEEDVLGSNVLPDRQTLRINFDGSEDECNWDIKVNLADGTSREQRNVNLCRTAEVEVSD